jgi:mannosyltransferase OCH1-like enzyme
MYNKLSIIIIIVLIIIINNIIISNKYNFEFFDMTSKTIPKVIYLSYKTKNIPEYVIKNWKKLNPGYEVKLYDNDDCKNFLIEHYTQKHVDIFDFIKDGPIKADFWRVCVLNTYGGVYSDIDVELLVPIDEIIEEGVTFLTCGSFAGGINPHFIMTVKNHPLLLDCLNTYLDMYDNNVKYEYWTYSIVFNIMLPNIKKYIDYDPNKEGILYDKFQNKYQIISEKNPGEYTKIFCSYKSVKVLNNRYNKYNYNSHSFENFLFI